MDTTKPQGFSGRLADEFVRAPGVQDTTSRVERTLNDWFEKVLSEALPLNGVIGDFCCGSGRVLKLLATPHRKVIGFEVSSEMIGKALQDFPSLTVIDESASSDEIIEKIQISRSLYVRADVLEIVPRLSRAGLVLNGGVLVFAGGSFSDPRAIISAIGSILHTGSPFFYLGNVFLEDSVVREISFPTRIDLFRDPPWAGFPVGQRFSHSLQFDSGELSLEEFAHHPGLLATAFDVSAWSAVETRVFAADACLHTQSDASNHAMINPGDGFTYLKVGILAWKR